MLCLCHYLIVPYTLQPRLSSLATGTYRLQCQCMPSPSSTLYPSRVVSTPHAAQTYRQDCSQEKNFKSWSQCSKKDICFHCFIFISGEIKSIVYPVPLLWLCHLPVGQTVVATSIITGNPKSKLSDEHGSPIRLTSKRKKASSHDI